MKRLNRQKPPRTNDFIYRNVMNKNKKILIFILAFLHLVAVEFIRGLSGDFGPYFGTGIFSYRPESLIVFVACLIMLGRFFDQAVLKDKGRVIISVCLGILLGFCSVWGQYVLYETTLFDESSKVLTAFFMSGLFSVFTIPLVSEIIGLLNKISGSLYDWSEDSDRKRRPLYFVLISLVTFITYIPLFLYVWPMNFFGDSYDELLAQLIGRRTTHHTVIHGLMLRKFYELGLKMGAPEKGMQLMTLLQMALLALSIGVFMLYVYDRGFSKKVRITLFALCVINPVNGYYAVTAEKGTMGIALALIGMTYLMRFLDALDKDEPAKNKIVSTAVFVIASSLGCLFRNNMVYALFLGGLIIALLRKGAKQKIIVFLTVLLLFGSYTAENNLLIKAEGSITADKYRETLPLPIMCLARVYILHGDEMDPALKETILAYIPENAMGEYVISISDGVKAQANEELFKQDMSTFIKIFIKCGLKYPGDYIDQFAWLTYGYWNPYDAFTMGSTTPYVVKPLPEEFADVKNTDLIPALDGLFGAVYYETGRFRIPLISWFYRCTLYVWSVIFLLVAGLVRKSRRMISLAAVPFFYLVTVFAGPLCQFRYVYFNVLTFPLILLAIAEGYGKARGNAEK